ncbi:hypothetical protein J6590_015068 [Homalodisca vitripennis]|nr:hypothetical protein J6590_015068 [Homalodisca vitripennis]
MTKSEIRVRIPAEQSKDLETSLQVLQSEYYDPLSTLSQKRPVSRTVGPRPVPWTHCPPLRKSKMSRAPTNDQQETSFWPCPGQYSLSEIGVEDKIPAKTITNF